MTSNICRRLPKNVRNRKRISAKAESSVVVLKKLRLLSAMHAENPYKEYEAIITRVKNFGIYFEIIELLLEGFIHISELEEDYFVFEEEKMRLRGTRKGSIYSPGNRLTVMLQDVNFISQETKWYVVSNLHSTVKTEIKAGKKQPSRDDEGKPSRRRESPKRETKRPAKKDVAEKSGPGKSGSGKRGTKKVKATKEAPLKPKKSRRPKKG